MSVSEYGVIFTAVGLVLGGFRWIAGWALAQFETRLEERFKAQDAARLEGRQAYEARLATLESEHRQLQTKFLEHLADLPVNYMRREDHIRFETVINAKLDAVAAKQDLLAERLPRRD